MRAILLPTGLAMAAFAGNSLLARAALAPDSQGAPAIDAASFTAIRLVSGAIALAAVVAAQSGLATLRRAPGSWPSALALLAYALGFSFAYLRLGAATGALVLFAAVQGSMILWGATHGDRPTPRELAGLAVAATAFVALLLPGLQAPDPLGSLLMTGAGIAWGIYSLRGRGAGPPLPETAGNFLRAGLVCSPLLGYLAAGQASTRGIWLAAASGIVTSGFGYAIWYQALPRLTTTQAATVQLTVPLLAGLAAVLLLGESPGWRLILCSACILGGVAFAILARTARRETT